MIVDAHHHFWNPARIAQPWMTHEHAAIARPFEPPDLEPLLEACGITSTVLVQSAANDADTDYMFELAEDVGWVGGIVAWVPLDDAAGARSRLRRLKQSPKLRGVRNLIHQEPDPHWILRPQVSEGLGLLEEEGLVLELPAEFPRHLEDVPELAARHPALSLVIDHLAKPPIGTEAMRQWRDQLEAAAAHSNVAAKISGLNTVLPPGGWGAGDLVPAVQVAFDAFGPDRLMFGSDWPVALLNGMYAEVVSCTIEAIERVAGDAASAILGETAARLYRLER